MNAVHDVVVDASVIVKWFVDETQSQQALALRDKHVSREIQIIAPEILPFEVLNALYYKKLFSEEELKEISKAIEAYSFRLFPLIGNYTQITVEVACRNDITLYDASYIALAMFKNTYLYTVDLKLIRKLKAEYTKYVKNISSILD